MCLYSVRIQTWCKYMHAHAAWIQLICSNTFFLLWAFQRSSFLQILMLSSAEERLLRISSLFSIFIHVKCAPLQIFSFYCAALCILSDNFPLKLSPCVWLCFIGSVGKDPVGAPNVPDLGATPLIFPESGLCLMTPTASVESESGFCSAFLSVLFQLKRRFFLTRFHLFWFSRSTIEY